MITQHDILDKIAQMLDSGKLRCTMTKSLTPLNATNLRKAHRLVESGHMTGKLGFSAGRIIKIVLTSIGVCR